MNDQISISIIIPVYNQVNYTAKCINSILNNLKLGINLEVIIINNGSTDNTMQYLNKLPSNLFLIINNKKNLGFSKACNQGAVKAKGNFLVFLNNDVIALSGWLTEMISVYKDNVGVVGSKLLYPNGSIQHAGIVIVSNKKDPLFAKHNYYKKPGNLPEANLLRDYQAVTGACMLVKKELFFDVNCFDENYINGYEDIDLCFKVKQKGYRIIYCPKSTLYHYESITPGRYDNVSHNVSILHKKWLNIITPDHIMINRSIIKNSTSTSIIIPCFNQLKYTMKCINSIIKYTKEPYELVLIDNGSTDGTSKYFEKLYQDKLKLIIIKNSTNIGYGAACNQGIKAATGNYIMLLNNDTVVTEGWLTRMLIVGNNFQDIGIIGPRSNEVSGAQKIVNISYKNEQEMHEYAQKRAVLHLAQGFATNRAVGFCMLIKKEVVDFIGGFDLRFGLGNYEDDDICLRARIAGYKIWICNDVFIHHYGSKTFIGNQLNHTKLMAENWNNFKNKWKVSKETMQNEEINLSTIINQEFNSLLHFCPLNGSSIK